MGNFCSWCNETIIKVIVVVCLLFFIIFIIFVAGISNNFQVIDANNTALSTKKIEWGIKRGKDHAQPDLGSENLRIINEFNGMAMGSDEYKYLYLTFDNGYEAGYTEQILDVLKENDVKATFFITGQYLKTSEDLVKRMIDEGHIVGNHTVNHKSMPSCTNETIKEEVMTLHQNVYEKFNYEMKYMRPPKGEYSEASIAYTNTLGYTTVMWSFAYDDWVEDNQGREEYAKSKIYDNLHNGEIMLLHATSKDNANILDEVIKEIKNQGYEFKSLDEFVR